MAPKCHFPDVSGPSWSSQTCQKSTLTCPSSNLRRRAGKGLANPSPPDQGGGSENSENFRIFLKIHKARHSQITSDPFLICDQLKNHSFLRPMASRFAHFYAKNELNLDPLWAQIAEDRAQAILTTAHSSFQELFPNSVFGVLRFTMCCF